MGELRESIALRSGVGEMRDVMERQANGKSRNRMPLLELPGDERETGFHVENGKCSDVHCPFTFLR